MTVFACDQSDLSQLRIGQCELNMHVAFAIEFSICMSVKGLASDGHAFHCCTLLPNGSDVMGTSRSDITVMNKSGSHSFKPVGGQVLAQAADVYIKLPVDLMRLEAVELDMHCMLSPA